MSPCAWLMNQRPVYVLASVAAATSSGTTCADVHLHSSNALARLQRDVEARATAPASVMGASHGAGGGLPGDGSTVPGQVSSSTWLQNNYASYDAAAAAIVADGTSHAAGSSAGLPTRVGLVSHCWWAPPSRSHQQPAESPAPRVACSWHHGATRDCRVGMCVPAVGAYDNAGAGAGHQCGRCCAHGTLF